MKRRVGKIPLNTAGSPAAEDSYTPQTRCLYFRDLPKIYMAYSFLYEKFLKIENLEQLPVKITA